MKPRPQHSPGFSLITMSIILTAAAIVFVSFLPGKEAGDYNHKTLSNIQRLQKIEEAMRGFMVFNGRRPCPAQGSYDINAHNFGIEASNAGGCTGGTPAAPMGPDSATGHIVSGTIPTKSLGLPDEYAFDQFGRRFTYVVDSRATTTGSCISLMGYPSLGTGQGDLLIKDGTGGTTIDHTMYAYISHGPSGFGAFPAQGGTPGTRINTGSTDTDMLTNAGVDGNFTYNTTNFTNVRVKKPRTSTFDDLVWYRNDLKNTCCIGPRCTPLGFRIDKAYKIVGIGDVNGDGIQDLVLYSGTTIYVVFGTATGFPIPPNGLDLTTLNGTNGFAITGGGTSGPPSVGDVNGDGTADIFIPVNNGFNGGYYYLLFGDDGGGTHTWPATVNLGNLNGYNTLHNGTSGVKIIVKFPAGSPFYVSTPSNGISWDSYYVTGTTAIADVDGYVSADGKKYNDLIAYGTCVNCTMGDLGFVIYGKPSTGDPGNNDWAHTPTVDISSLDAATTGFIIESTQSNITGNNGTAFISDAADFDQDGEADFVIYAPSATNVGTSGNILVVYGRPRTGGSSGSDWQTAATGTAPSLLDLKNEVAASSPNRVTTFYNTDGGDNGLYAWRGAAHAVNANNDAAPDLLINGAGGPAVTYGLVGSRWPATFNQSTMTLAQGIARQVNCCGSGWLGSPTATMADVNGDGRPDLIMTNQDSPLSRSNAYTVFVMYQPASGWPEVRLKYYDFKWDGTDSFKIFGPEANSACGYGGPPFVADVRPGDGGKPEIIIPCNLGESPNASIYGLYKNKGWPSSIDLNNLN